MRLVYLAMHTLPTLAVLALAWYVVSAVSVRVVWRKAVSDRLDDETA
jgi:hypothetical protein